MCVKRLYNDFRISPLMTVRAGKLLTQVGKWNLTHTAVHDSTVSQPLTAYYYSISQCLTGAASVVRRIVGVMPLAQMHILPGFDRFSNGAQRQSRQYEDVAGLGLGYLRPAGGRFGVSMSSTRVRGSDHMRVSANGKFVTGLLWRQFRAEKTCIHGDAEGRMRCSEGSGPLQAANRITDCWFVVWQVEACQARGYLASVSSSLTGMVCRSSLATAGTLEYMGARGIPIGTSSGLYGAWVASF